LSTVIERASNHSQVARTTYNYDPHGRIASTFDFRNGTNFYTYNAADQVVSITTPEPGTGETAQVTVSCYDEMNRLTGQYREPTACRHILQN
jgi:YD repeat-containing protein